MIMTTGMSVLPILALASWVQSRGNLVIAVVPSSPTASPR